MITGEVKKRTDGYRYVTIPKHRTEFSEGDQVKITKVEE